MKKLLPLLVVLALAVSACLGSDDSALTEAGERGLTAPEAPVVEDRGESAGSGGIVAAQTGFVLPADVKVIRQGTLSLRVEPGTFDDALAQLRLIAFDSGGYVSDASTDVTTHGDERYVSGSVTIRVPGDRFDDVLDRLAGIGERLSLRVESQDVTEEYVDLEARLEHWQAMERFHLQLLEEAVTVEEALRVQEELSAVQLTIETLEGRLRYLDSRTDFATLTVAMTEAPDAIPAVTTTDPGPLAKAWSEAVEVLMESLGFILVAAAGLLPFAALAGVAWVIWRLARRKEVTEVVTEA